MGPTQMNDGINCQKTLQGTASENANFAKYARKTDFRGAETFISGEVTGGRAEVLQIVYRSGHHSQPFSEIKPLPARFFSLFLSNPPKPFQELLGMQPAIESTI